MREKMDFSRTKILSKSQASLRDPLESVRSHGISYLSSSNAKSVSVSDIRKAFETQCIQNQNAAVAAASTASVSRCAPALPPRDTTAALESSATPSKRNVLDKASDKSGQKKKHESYVVDHRSDSSFDSTMEYDDSEAASPTR